MPRVAAVLSWMVRRGNAPEPLFHFQNGAPLTQQGLGIRSGITESIANDRRGSTHSNLEATCTALEQALQLQRHSKASAMPPLNCLKDGTARHTKCILRHQSPAWLVTRGLWSILTSLLQTVHGSEQPDAQR